MQRFAASFPIVLVTGPRQVGKSTALHHSFPDIPYLTFDDPSQQLSVKQDPKTFLNMHQSPRIFDEVQYIPELFPYLKMDVDSRGEQGMYYLTGSQQFSMMQRVSESLAGRIGILQLLGISLRERFGDSLYSPFIPTREFIQERKSPNSCPAPKLWEYIHQGSFPVIVTKQVQAEDYYGSYVKTYLERDVRLLAQVGDELQFLQFLTVVASRTGQLLNYSDLAKEVGITGPTAKRWVSILVSTGLVYLLKPYATNVEKQVVKTPKLYFLDTGLACWLTKWSS
ncbi:MAG: ATP-binding protein, partial [Spirochaetales bacterium]|nr:ATP-binding protein [Spirochaetales bacterium]